MQGSGDGQCAGVQRWTGLRWASLLFQCHPSPRLWKQAKLYWYPLPAIHTLPRPLHRTRPVEMQGNSSEAWASWKEAFLEASICSLGTEKCWYPQQEGSPSSRYQPYAFPGCMLGPGQLCLAATPAKAYSKANETLADTGSCPLHTRSCCV